MPAFRLLLFLPFIWVPTLAFGEGSVSWNEIENQLEMAPEIRAHLSKTLDIEEAGSGMRLGRHWGELQGARVGPYRFNAKPKGAAGGWQFALVVEVDITFLDAQGRPSKPIPIRTTPSKSGSHLSRRNSNLLEELAAWRS